VLAQAVIRGAVVRGRDRAGELALNRYLRPVPNRHSHVSRMARIGRIVDYVSVGNLKPVKPFPETRFGKAVSEACIVVVAADLTLLKRPRRGGRL
jgi:hypothetical protein